MSVLYGEEAYQKELECRNQWCRKRSYWTKMSNLLERFYNRIGLPAHSLLQSQLSLLRVGSQGPLNMGQSSLHQMRTTSEV